MDVCYFCGDEANSDEHAPPKSFFPKGMRENLITVRSCPKHNNDKSKDDEYVRLFVVGTLDPAVSTNEKVQSTAIRGVVRKHALGFKMLNNAEVVNGEIAVDFDYSRFESFFDSLARAIYFHHFGSSLSTDIDLYIFKLRFADLDFGLQDFLRIKENECRIRFDGLEKHGSNQEVFYYQVSYDEKALKLVLYDSFIVYVTLS
ncbi:TPA: hypothetical protein NGT44_002902 [Vibrio parahaemolyticus]|uniref:hypothetical protein n=1 Tax=Vibrio parahaemolyticus TaxID=670 RepID=UPI0011246445|nr:hypothetical protein [Vibrio parahaemolyticus]TOQ48407.1 hypothetical protein CGG94_23615 [Vibrio parahaemolyticus]HCE2179316.1 hypothetical protein [Vibrio parahaemolyticus]HCG7544485.1 hypothetical protein [Vibrio parahaemolyticus]HCH0358781.1 hypothetical protein [Vibrio parahaemolyticus]HCH5750524.1 hypothetical protein [Vibrio parahaemolyticus]